MPEHTPQTAAARMVAESRLLAIREAQIDYLTAKGAAGNVAGACSVPLLLLEKAQTQALRDQAQRAYEACAAAMVALDALTAILGQEMARAQGDHARTGSHQRGGLH